MGKDLFNPHLRKFSIRKLNVGVCSVLLSTLLLLGAAAQVSADEASDSGVQNEVSQTGIAESSVNSAETVASEHIQAKGSSALAFATEIPQSDDNPSPTSSEPEKVEGSTESTATKSVENTQPITVHPEISNAAVVAEKSEAIADVSQPNRSRRVRRDATPTGQQNSVTTGVPIGTGPAGADDATSTPRVPKPNLEESVKKDSTQLAKQISWLDFSDSSSWKNLNQSGGLQVGTTFTKEISPGYVVTLTVKELKPFNSTEIYRKRVAGTATEGTYNPNAENGFLKSAPDYGKTPPPSVTGAVQNEWTTIRDQGFNTQKRKTQLVFPKNSANWGVKFNIEATYLGKRVAPTVVMADGEDANPGEFAIFTTNGEGWEYLGEWKNKSTAKEAYTVITKQMVDEADKKTRGGLLILRDTSVDWYKYLSPDTVTGGLGTQVFGPNRSNERTVPVVMTRGASEVGFYVASSGQQAMMMGFLVVDGSDAPESYGEAFHTISGRDSVTNAPIKQPYLGTTPADIDVESANDWVLDDKKEHKDEGASQLLADDQLSASNDLLDLDKAKNGTYTIKIKANPNGNAKSYVKAWIDFNNDGVFSESEGSNLQEITDAGDYTLTFNANPNISGGQVDKLGMRFRIATNKGDIEQPTGIAFSGEVEDMLLHRIYPPKGEKQTTDGFTGETQTAVLHFTPKGTDRSDDSVNAVMSSQAPQVLDNQGNVLQSADGTSYIRPEGTYVVTNNGNDVQVSFTPNADFSGTADGINIRWTDSNGTSTGWTSTDASDPNKNDQLNNMDGRYVPTVRKIPNYESSGLQGLEQNKTLVFNDDDANTPPVTPDASRPASFVDANGRLVTDNTVPAMANGQQVGTYELDPNTGQVTFKPIKTFYGTPDPVVVQVSDTDGKAHRARYQPKVTQVTPRSTNAESTGLQGQAQSGKPTFTAGDQQIPIDMSKAMTFENGTDTLEVANEGTYTINSDDTITFKPLKQFTGKATPVTVKRVDANGTEVTATYTPNVTKVTPTSTPATSSGPQGVPQTGTPVFKEGDPAVPIDYNKQMTFDDDQPKKTVAGVGEYTINSDGSITFTPDKKYVGTPAAVTVKRVDENGTEIRATYTPTVTEVTPSSTNAVSSGLQGQPQSGKPTFTPGDKAVPIDMAQPMTFEDNQTTKKVDKVGTYVIESDGTITFTPEKQYVGTPAPVTVKRVDTNGTEVTATYTPTVTRVTPTSTNAESTGLQGQPQSGKPTFSPGDQAVPIDMTQPMTFENGTDTLVVADQGTYTINSDGSITFKPEKKFTGKATPVKVKRVDTNGTEVTATYTPTVEEVIPNATGDQTEGPQGLVQNGKITFEAGRPEVGFSVDSTPVFDTGTNVKEIENVGKFEVDIDGNITFTPVKTFVGKTPEIEVSRADVNGTIAKAKYQATVTAVKPTGVGNKTEGLQGQVQEGKVTFTPGHDSVPFPAGSTPLFDNHSTVKEVQNVGKFEVDSDGKVTFTPVKQFKGETPELELTRTDANGTPVTVKYQAVVKEVVPRGTDATSTGPQGVPQTGSPSFQGGDPLVPIDMDSPMTFEDGQPKKTVQGVGEYTINSDGTITFTPDKRYVGTPAPVTVKRVDKNGTEVTATYTPTVTRVTPTSTNAESTGLQGQPQSGKPTFSPGDQAVPIDMTKPMTFENGTDTLVVANQGTYTINSDGSITFTPDKQFTGKATPVTVKRVDANGTEITATYTPTVTKVTPTGTNAESTGIQGQPQNGTPTFTPGDSAVPIDMDSPMTFDDGQPKKTVPGVGVYTINSDGSITFTPDKRYVGTPVPVTVKRVDKNGTEVTASYTLTVTKVTPTGTNATSTGPQGVPQTGIPTFQGGNPLVPIDETVDPTFEDGSKEKKIPGQGTYTIAPDGVVTFTPEKQYVGTPEPVTVKRVDKNGTPVTATYSLEFTKVTPTSTNATSTGPQGLPQTGTPTFQGGDPLVPIDDTVEPTFEDGSKKKTITGQGTYTITPDGAVTFTPDKQFVGTPDPITVKRVDKNGTPVTATYSPEFTKVTPTSTNATSTGPQGLPQTGTPTFAGGDSLVPIDETVEPTFEDGSKEKTIPGQGTYTITPDGAVTFTPDKQFVGKPDPITVKRVDKNGTPVTATYSPEFAKVTPTGKDASSTNIKGHVQTGKPVFEAGDSLVPIDETIAPTFEDGSKEKTIPGEGTYTITPDGTVTFTPDADFLGLGTGVTLDRRDKNGTSVTARYVPTVVEPSTSKDSVSSGRKGQAQTGTPTFEGAIDQAVAPTFADGSTEMVVPGEGTYRFTMLGAVTFVPEADFVGTASGVVVKRSDIYGNAVTATYTPTVLGSTATEDTGSTGLKGQPQTGKPIFEGDVDPTVPPTFEDGSTEKVVPGQGTYTIAPDGTVIFVPETGFVGQADGVTVIRKDRNGQTISAVYVPTVKEAPVQPERTITPAPPSLSKSEGAKALPKTGTEETSYLAAILLAGVSGLGLMGLEKRKKKSED